MRTSSVVGLLSAELVGNWRSSNPFASRLLLITFLSSCLMPDLSLDCLASGILTASCLLKCLTAASLLSLNKSPALRGCNHKVDSLLNVFRAGKSKDLSLTVNPESLSLLVKQLKQYVFFINQINRRLLTCVRQLCDKPVCRAVNSPG